MRVRPGFVLLPSGARLSYPAARPKPRTKRANAHREHSLQERMAEWMEASLPKDGRVVWSGYDLSIPVRSPEMAAWAAQVGAMRKRRGIKPGFADFWVLSSTYLRGGVLVTDGFPGLLVLVEAKDEGGSLEASQRALMPRMRTAGALWFTCRTTAEVEAALRSAGVPVLSRDLFPAEVPRQE